MKMKMRPRYYCEHCNKGSGSPSAMKRHENGCTKNPHRVCGMCRRMIDEGLQENENPSRDELIAILDREGFEALSIAANDCPACILSVIRTKNRFDDNEGCYIDGPKDGRELWNFNEAKKEFWDALNEESSLYNH